MHIYLVRHTEYVNPDNVFAFFLPFYLSDEGRKKAGRIGSWFVQKGCMGIPIYTSPIVRTVQSAEIIASKTESFVKTDGRLIEVACPNLQGKKQPEKPWIAEEDDPSHESRDAVRARMLSILEEKIQENTDCIFVSHGEGTTILYYHFLKKDLPKYLWSTENKENVIHRGDIVDLEITGAAVTSVRRISSL